MICQHYGSECNHEIGWTTNEMLVTKTYRRNLLKSWVLVVDEIGWGWNPPADLNGMPAACCEWAVAGEKLPSLTKPVWAVVPLWGVPACCWKFPCGGNCWFGCPGAARSWACCNRNCCWCCCINLSWCVSCCKTPCCCAVRFCVCWRQWSIWSCCWVR